RAGRKPVDAGGLSAPDADRGGVLRPLGPGVAAGGGQRSRGEGSGCAGHGRAGRKGGAGIHLPYARPGGGRKIRGEGRCGGEGGVTLCPDPLRRRRATGRQALGGGRACHANLGQGGVTGRPFWTPRRSSAGRSPSPRTAAWRSTASWSGAGPWRSG